MMKLVTFQFYVLLSFVSTTLAIPNLANSVLVMSYWKVLPAVPPNFDFWKATQELGFDKATNYADRAMKEEFIKYSVPLDNLDKLKQGMKDLIDSTKVLQMPQAHTMDNFNFNVTEFNQMLSAEIDLVIERLRAEFQEPLPEDQAERGQKREEAAIKGLDMIENALVNVYGHWDEPEDVVREKFSHVRPHVLHIVLVVGSLVDNHPYVLDIVMFTVVVMMLPEFMPLRFVARAFGIGPLGPVKGSLAAWAQRFFYGGIIEAGSWFAMLQKAGMLFNLPSFWQAIRIWVLGAFGWIFKEISRQ